VGGQSQLLGHGQAALQVGLGQDEDELLAAVAGEVSMSRTLPVTRPANSTSTSSPRWCPNRSLTDLKWSTSSMSRARTRPKRRERSISCSK
jgi:hypothetical protein